jgi:hypothetical protein
MPTDVIQRQFTWFGEFMKALDKALQTTIPQPALPPFQPSRMPHK